MMQKKHRNSGYLAFENTLLLILAIAFLSICGLLVQFLQGLHINDEATLSTADGLQLSLLLFTMVTILGSATMILLTLYRKKRKTHRLSPHNNTIWQDEQMLELLTLEMAEEDQQQHISPLKDASHEKIVLYERLLDNLSHDLRTPLNGIVGFAELLEKCTVLDTQQRRYVAGIRSTSHLLIASMENFLGLSEMESSGYMEQENTPFNLQSLLEDVVDMLAPRARLKMIDIAYCYAINRQHFLGDPSWIRQILSNLISNAIRYTEQGYVCITVSIHEENSINATIYIDCADSGIGFSKQQSKGLFRRFSTLHKQSIAGSSGLGLYIAREWAQRMGGDISYRSKPMQGSTFSFSAPLQKNIHYSEKGQVLNTHLQLLFVHDQAEIRDCITKQLRRSIHSVTAISAKQVNEKLPAATAVLVDAKCLQQQGSQWLKKIIAHGAPVYLALYDDQQDLLMMAQNAGISDSIYYLLHQHEIQRLFAPQPKKIIPQPLRDDRHILIVEDDPVHCLVLQKFLRDLGWQTDVANSAKQALKKHLNKEYNVVIMDYELPDYKAPELLAQMYAQKSRNQSSTRYLATSSHRSHDFPLRCIEDYGFDGYYSKPLDFERLQQELLYPQQHNKSEKEPPSSPSTHNLKTINKEELWQRLELDSRNSDRVLLTDLVQQFRLESAELIQALENAVIQKKDAVVNGLLHRLKGLASLVSGERLYHATKQLEQAVKSKQKPNTVQQRLRCLQREVIESQKSLQQLLQGGN